MNTDKRFYYIYCYYSNYNLIERYSHQRNLDNIIITKIKILHKS